MRVQFLNKVVTCPSLRRQVHGDAASAVPVTSWGFANSESASDSVHRAG